jgi:hypothetical protein
VFRTPYKTCAQLSYSPYIFSHLFSIFEAEIPTMSSKIKEIKTWIKSEMDKEYRESHDSPLFDFYETYYIHRSEYKFLKKHSERFKTDLANPKRSLEVKSKAVKALAMGNSRVELFNMFIEHFLGKIPFSNFEFLPATSSAVKLVGEKLMKFSVNLLYVIIFTMGCIAENIDMANEDERFRGYVNKAEELRQKFLPLYWHFFKMTEKDFSPFHRAVSSILGSYLDCSHWIFEKCVFELNLVLRRSLDELKTFDYLLILDLSENCKKMQWCNKRTQKLTNEQHLELYHSYFAAFERIWSAGYFLDDEKRDCKSLQLILTVAKNCILNIGYDSTSSNLYWQFAILCHYLCILRGMQGYCAECHRQGSNKCSWCRLPRYCSEECLKKQWPSHKRFCSKNHPETFESLLAAISSLPPWLLPIPADKASVFNHTRVMPSDLSNNSVSIVTDID